MTAIDLASQKPSWKKVNEIYKKYSRGQDMGELAMREITGMLWMADTINRAKSVDPATLAAAHDRYNWRVQAEVLLAAYAGLVGKGARR